MQKITIAGNLGKDPEERFTASGEKVVSFSVAVNRRRGGKDETYWYRVSIFGNRFDKMLTYLKKGSSVIVTGDFSTNKWKDASGVEQTSFEVVADSLSFSPFGRQSDQPGSEGQQQNSFSNRQPASVAQSTFGQGGMADADDSEPLPF